MEEEEVADRLKQANSRADEEDGSLIIYTSGTTGRPKGKLFRAVAFTRARPPEPNIMPRISDACHV